MWVQAIVLHASTVTADGTWKLQLGKENIIALCEKKNLRKNKLPVFLKSPTKLLDNSNSSSQPPPSTRIKSAPLANETASSDVGFVKSTKQKERVSELTEAAYTTSTRG